ncbi:MAG: alpha/beta fold hydrolase [Cardiobacteriaceae bacterium]|nr:alpha/beta fold hydrolase [Cardiobacteriaceae bacterium]
MIYYQTYGQKQSQAVVLLHSGGMAGEEWHPQIDSLAGRFHVLIPDLPGHGKSPLHSERLSVRLMAEAVLDMLDAENLYEVNICGSSMGGAVALWLALNHPTRIKRLVIYRIGYRTNPDIHSQVNAMGDPTYWESFGLAAWLAKLHTPQGGKDAWKTVIARVGDALHGDDTQHMHHLNSLAAIRCPTLIIAGDRDPLAPLADMLNMYRTIPDAALWIIPHAAHITATNTWRAPAFTEELRRFFSREATKKTP